jgi:tetratricopeptide (TPR) repeat protein
MKKHSWLSALENVSLVGLGAGSVASLLSSQFFFTTAPLSLLVVLGLVNRRRLAQVTERRTATFSETDQYLALQVDRLHEQITGLPTPETINRLNRSLLQKNQEVADKMHGEMLVLKQGMHQRIAAVEQQGLGAVRQEVRQLIERCNYLMETVQQLTTDFGDLSSQVQADGLQLTVDQLKQDIGALQTNFESLHQTKPNLSVLQEHITRLDRQFSKLPPPVDLSSLKQEVGELIKIVADLVPRRDFGSLVSEIKSLHEQQETLKQSVVAIETAALNFKRTFNELPKLNELNDSLGKLNAAEAELTNQQASLSVLASSSSVYPELQELATGYLNNLRVQLGTIQEFTNHLAQQQKQLREQLNQLPQTLDVVALQRQLSELSQRLPVSEGAIESFKSRVQDVLRQELDYINQQLQVVANAPQSELIFDFQPLQAGEPAIAGSRAILEQALDSTQQRLILIWPWSNQSGLDVTLFDKFEAFLQQGKQLEIGWCYLTDRQEERWLSKMQRGWMTDLADRSLLQETLHKFLQLKRVYADRFQFKILGTAENFLVSDQSFAVLGIAEGLKTTTAFPELQLKLKTTDAAVIERLIQRFDDPVLADDDLTSYWNRAVTRYDLGDKQGAVADYTHLLSAYPNDGVALNHRGLAYYDLGELDQAIADFTAAVHHMPDASVAYCNRGFIRAEQGNHWEALQDYSLALQARPHSPMAYFYRGMSQHKLENYTEAIADFGEAIRLAPDAAVPYYYRGLAWQKLGNHSEAIADFELAGQFFWVRGSKTNAQKAMKQVAKLRQELSQEMSQELAQPSTYQNHLTHAHAEAVTEHMLEQDIHSQAIYSA